MGTASSILLIGVIVVALVLFVPQILPQLEGQSLKDGDSVSISGTLMMLNNPPTSQVVLTVMVWGIQEPLVSISSLHVGTGRTFYLSRLLSTLPIMALDGFAVSDFVSVTGTYHEVLDVNNNKVMFIQYQTMTQAQ